MAHQLPGFLSSVAGPIGHYGYWAIALFLLLENIGVPVIPGEFSLIAGAILAGSGDSKLNIYLVGTVAVLAAFTGAEIGYGIGRLAGRELIVRYGRYVLIREHHLEKAERTVDRFGPVVVIIARFIVVLRELNGLIAGITGMRIRVFTLFNAISACLWVATWTALGDLAGDHIDTIYRDVSRYSLYVLIGAAVLLAGYLMYRFTRRRRAAGTGQPPAAGDADPDPGPPSAPRNRP